MYRMFSGGPSLSARLANIQHMPVLMAATVASDKPIDPYLIKDITKMSFESGQARAFLQQYLLHQLVTSRNVYVKFKVLKILEELLERGHIEFKQNLRKQPEPLNEASRLRATQNRDGGLVTECARIRDMSNKLLEMLYCDAPELQPKRYPPPEIRSTHGESSGPSKMEGFGNSSYVNPKTKSTSATTDKLKALFGSNTKAPGPLVYDESYATMDPVPHNMHAPGAAAVSGGRLYTAGAGYNPGRYLEHGLPEGAPHRSGEAGGGWGSPSELHPHPHPHPPPPPVAVEDTVQHEDYHTLSRLEDEERNTEQERRLVDDITAPGGVKAAPPRDSLNRFISRCKVLDTLAVIEFLRQKLQDHEQTQIILRTLFVVEAMIKSDIPEVLSQLDLVLEELQSLTDCTNTTIRAKAKKILQQLSVEEDSRKQAVTTDSVCGTVTSGTILDLEGEGEGGREQPHTNESSTANAAGLFAGLSLSGQPTDSGGPLRSGPPDSRPLRSGPPESGPPARQVPPHQGGPEMEPGGGFADLLGLSATEMTSATDGTSHIKGSTATDRTRGEGEGEVSLMDLEDGRDENFDPLTRTESLGSKSYSNTGSLSLCNQTVAPPPSGSNGVMTELSGLDLTLSSQTNTPFQNGTGAAILQAHQMDNSLFPSSSTASHAPQSGVVGGAYGPIPAPQLAVGGAYGGVQIPGRVGYVTAGPIPYGMQTGQTTVPQVQMGMPVYTAAQGAPVMYMNQPRLGGDARPVQRPQATGNTEQQISSFDFLGKSSKGTAFDFVKDEIDSAKKK